MKRQQLISVPRAAIYARVSSQKQKEGETIESQLMALRVFAKEKGFDIPEKLIFADDGVSGSILQRPALDELRDVVRAEPLNYIFVYSPDRLSRNYAHQLILLEELRKHGVQAFFLKAPPEANTPEAKMFTHMQGIFAEYERALILDRSRRGRMHKARQNDPIILPCMPYGYERAKEGQKSAVYIKENEAVVVKEVFRLYVHERVSLRKVANTMTEKGVKPPKKGSEWHVSTVRGILKNQAYIGTAHYGKTERCEGTPNYIRHCRSGTFHKPKYARKIKSESEWIPIDMPQIIGESDFELAQERLKENAALAARNTKELGLLQGLLICEECGEAFHKITRKVSGRIVTSKYRCRSYRMKDKKKCENPAVIQHEIDDLVYQEILKLLKNPFLIKKEISRRAEEAGNIKGIEQQEITLKKELSKLSQELDRLLDAYQAELLTIEDLGKRRQAIDVRRRDIEKAIKSAQAFKMECEGMKELESSFNHILSRMQTAATTLNFIEKQKIVRLLVQKVLIKSGRVTIVHCISPRLFTQKSDNLSFDGCG